MKTLESQLADYGERQRELHGPISPGELAVTLGQSDRKARLPSPRRRGLWVGVTSAAATLVVFGLIPPLVNSDTPSSVANTVATTPAVAPAIPSSSGWSRIPHDEAVFGGEGGQEMLSVVSGGPGLVAVGQGDDGAAVWTSVDGVSWSRVPHDDSVFGGGEMRSVTAGGPGLVAVGQEGTGFSDDFGWGHQDAAVWTSVDGISWSRAPYDQAVFGGPSNQSMVNVTVGGPGLVAVGWDDSNAAVWTSVDGITNHLVPSPAQRVGIRFRR